MRAFLALVPPSELLMSLRARVDSIQAVDTQQDLRWIPAVNLHTTLLFMPEVAEEAIAALAAECQSALGRVGPLVIELTLVGPFPSKGKHKLITAMVRPTDELIELHQAIKKCAHKCAIVYDGQSYLPHITVARLKKWHKYPAALSFEPMPIDFAWEARHVTCFQSITHAEGPEYRSLFEVDLLTC